MNGNDPGIAGRHHLALFRSGPKVGIFALQLAQPQGTRLKPREVAPTF